MALNLDKATSASMIKNIASKSSEENLKKTVKNINIDLIDFNEDNDKIFSVDNLEPLVSTIKRNGFKGSIEVFLKSDGRYEIISGHRRFLANKLVGNNTIPCEVKEEPSDIEKADLLIISNITSRQLTPLEKGRAIVYYKENVLKPSNFTGNVREEIAKRFGYSSSNVHKYEALTKLIEELQDLVEKEGYPFAPMSSASSLSEADQRKLYDMLIKHSEIYPNGVISGTRIEEYILNIKEDKNKPQKGKNTKSSTKNTEVRDVVRSQVDLFKSNESNNYEIESDESDTQGTILQQEDIYYDAAVEESVERLIELLEEREFKDKKKVKDYLKRLETSIKNFK